MCIRACLMIRCHQLQDIKKGTFIMSQITVDVIYLFFNTPPRNTVSLVPPLWYPELK